MRDGGHFTSVSCRARIKNRDCSNRRGKKWKCEMVNSIFVFLKFSKRKFTKAHFLFLPKKTILWKNDKKFWKLLFRKCKNVIFAARQLVIYLSSAAFVWNHQNLLIYEHKLQNHYSVVKPADRKFTIQSQNFFFLFLENLSPFASIYF